MPHPAPLRPVFEDFGTPEHTPRAPPLEHRFDRLYIILISLHGLVRWAAPAYWWRSAVPWRVVWHEALLLLPLPFRLHLVCGALPAAC